jgi:AraC-like DNA-binding protein
MRRVNGRSTVVGLETLSADAARPIGTAPARHDAFAYHRAPTCDVEAVTATHARPSWTEFHDTFTVCIVERGAAVSYRCGSRQYRRDPAVGMLLGPADLQSDSPTLGVADYRVLRFAPVLLTSSDGRGADEVQPSLAVIDHELREQETNELFSSVHRAIELGSDRRTMDELLAGCILEVRRRCTSGQRAPSERHAVRRVREFALAHLAERITLDELAAFVGMGKWGLLTLFRRHVGVPPLRYVLQLRLARARTLLRAGRPPRAVAVDLGFFDQSHLTRWFRRTYGVAPGEYHQASRTGNSD